MEDRKHLNQKNDLGSVSHLRQYDCESFEQELCAQRILDDDPFTGWQTPMTNPKPLVTKKKKNKRSDNAAYTGERPQLGSYTNEAWGDSVDKYSYRYIQNNGCYRLLKSQTFTSKPSYSQRKPPSPAPGVVYGAEHRKLQREITLDLRKEFRSLLENNQNYFRLLHESPTAVVDYLEDEQEYKDSLAPVSVSGKSGKTVSAVTESGGQQANISQSSAQEIEDRLAKGGELHSTQLTHSTPVQSTKPLVVQSAQPISVHSTQLFSVQSHSTHPIPVQQTQPIPVQQTQPIPVQQTQPIPVQQTQPIPTRLEDLIIKKRCSTNLDRLRSEQGESCSGYDKPTVKYDKTQYKHTSAPTSRLYINPDDVESLANKTFNSRKGAVETKMRQLKPVEKITPSLREVYDNSKAMIDLMKFGSTLEVGNADSLSHRRVNHVICAESLAITKPKAVKAAFGSSVPSSNYRVTKLGESRQKVSLLSGVDEQMNTNFQTFLPSISGKRISTKIGSLR